MHSGNNSSMVANPSSLSTTGKKPAAHKYIDVELAAGNENQEEWLRSCRGYGNAKEAMGYVYPKANKYREATPEDLAAIHDLDKDKVKQEDDNGEDDYDAEADSDLDEQTPVTQLVMEQVVTFLGPDGKPESAEARRKRFDFSRALVASVPHHTEKLKTWVEGDIHSFFELVITNVQVSPVSLYQIMGEIKDVEFTSTMTISDLVNELHYLQKKANRVKKDAVSDDVLKGAFLSKCLAHPTFERLAEFYTQIGGDNMTYKEVIQEMRNKEDIVKQNKEKKRITTQANAVQDNPGEEILAFARTVMAQASNNQQQQKKNQVCRKYLEGRCTKTAEDCNRKHPPGKEGSKERTRTRTCFWCGKVGTHFAYNCPDKLAGKPRVRPNYSQDGQADNVTEQASSVTESKVDNHVQQQQGQAAVAQANNALSAFVKSLQGEASGSEAANLCKEDDLAAPKTSATPATDTDEPTSDYATATTDYQEAAHQAVAKTTEDKALLDSGASSTFLYSTDETLSTSGKAKPDPNTRIQCADSEQAPMQSNGRIDAALTIKGGAELQVKSAALIEGERLRQRLLSLGRMTADGYSFVFHDDDCVIFKQGKIITTIKRCNYLYPIAIAAASGQAKDEEAEHLAAYLAAVDSMIDKDYEKFVHTLSTNVHKLDDDATHAHHTSQAHDDGSTGTSDESMQESSNMEAHEDLVTENTQGDDSRQDGETVDFLQDDSHMAKTVTTPFDKVLTCKNFVEQALLARVFHGEKNLKKSLHQRFNHISLHEGSPLDLACKKIFGKKYTDCPDFFCDTCAKHKAHRLPHPRLPTIQRQLKAGQGPHGEIFVDTFSWPHPGPNGERYGTILYNQRMVTVITTKTRDQIPEEIFLELRRLNKIQESNTLTLNFSDFQVDVEEERGVAESDKASFPDKIKYVCTDGAAEFMCKAMDDYCRKQGITRINSCPYTPQQNAAEPMVKVVTQGTSVLQYQYGGPTSHWVFACRYYAAVHVVLPNKGPLGPYHTPYEAFFGIHVPWEKLIRGIHAYGTKAYVHIPKALRKHTHAVPVATMCYFLGLSHTRKGYVVVLAHNGQVLDGVWDLFVVENTFPLAEKRDHLRYKKSSEAALLPLPDSPHPSAQQQAEQQLEGWQASMLEKEETEEKHDDSSTSTAEEVANDDSNASSTAPEVSILSETDRTQNAGVDNTATEQVSQTQPHPPVSQTQQQASASQQPEFDHHEPNTILPQLEPLASSEEKQITQQHVSQQAHGSSSANTGDSGGAALRDVAENGGERDNISQHISSGITTESSIFDGVHGLVQATAHMRPPSAVEQEEKKEHTDTSSDQQNSYSRQQPRRSTRKKVLSMEALVAAANRPPVPPDSQQQAAARLARLAAANEEQKQESAVSAATQRASETGNMMEEAKAAYEAYTQATDIIIEKAKAAYEKAEQADDENSAPANRKQMLARKDADEFIEAEHEHLTKLYKLKVFKLIRKPEGANVMGGRYVYANKLRTHSNGGYEKSARYVAQGFTQQYGRDYLHTHAPTMALAALKINEARAVNDRSIITEGWDISGFYYLAKPLGLTQLLHLPPNFAEWWVRSGFPEQQFEGHVLLLCRCMPGTKDAGHHSNKALTNFLINELGMTVNPGDGASFHFQEGEVFISINWHVDDASAYSNSAKLLDYAFERINKRFPMKRQRDAKLIVGIHIERLPGKTVFHQKPLIEEIKQLSGVTPTKKSHTPLPGTWSPFTHEDLVTDQSQRAKLDQYPYRQLIGKLAYVARCTRPDILWVVSTLQQFQTNYGWRMIETLLMAISYLVTNADVCLTFQAGYTGPYALFVPVDASYAMDAIKRRSHAGHAVFFQGCLIYAVSRVLKTVATSATEAEFMSGFDAAKTAVEATRLVQGFNMKVKLPLPLLEDNKSAIHMSERPNLNAGRTRHMDVRWHWLQQCTHQGKVELTFVPTHLQIADVLTKPVTPVIFRQLRPLLMGEQPVQESGVFAFIKTTGKGIITTVDDSDEEEYEQALLLCDHQTSKLRAEAAIDEEDERHQAKSLAEEQLGVLQVALFGLTTASLHCGERANMMMEEHQHQRQGAAEEEAEVKEREEKRPEHEEHWLREQEALDRQGRIFPSYEPSEYHPPEEQAPDQAPNQGRRVFPNYEAMVEEVGFRPSYQQVERWRHHGVPWVVGGGEPGHDPIHMERPQNRHQTAAGYFIETRTPYEEAYARLVSTLAGSDANFPSWEHNQRLCMAARWIARHIVQYTEELDNVVWDAIRGLDDIRNIDRDRWGRHFERMVHGIHEFRDEEPVSPLEAAGDLERGQENNPNHDEPHNNNQRNEEDGAGALDNAEPEAAQPPGDGQEQEPNEAKDPAAVWFAHTHPFNTMLVEGRLRFSNGKRPWKQIETQQVRRRLAMEQAIDPMMRTVFITDGGARYHTGECYQVRWGRRRPVVYKAGLRLVNRGYAIEAGYTACAYCREP